MTSLEAPVPPPSSEPGPLGFFIPPNDEMEGGQTRTRMGVTAPPCEEWHPPLPLKKNISEEQMTLQKADPSLPALQAKITTAVIQRVADQATYTIAFKGAAPVTAISAKGAEELYQQCCMQHLCPELALVQANDKVVDGQWIVDGTWRATWRESGETYTIDARGTEPNIGPKSDNAVRVAFGKAKRNAHLSVVPSVIREAFLDHLTKRTGKPVVDNEEYSDRQDRNPTKTTKAPTKEKSPHEEVYTYAKSLGLDPVLDGGKIHLALGEKTVPEFLRSSSAESACALLKQHLGGTDGNND